jgi:hypothetical protein
MVVGVSPAWLNLEGVDILEQVCWGGCVTVFCQSGDKKFLLYM